MQIAIAILVILIVGAIAGSAFNFAGVFLGIPIVLIFLGVVLGKEQMERQRKVLQMNRFRREAQANKVKFSEADKRTMV